MSLMNAFAKSILNYFAAYTETRFSFQSKNMYKWTNDHLTCDFPIFPEFQEKILQNIKDRKAIELNVSKGEYLILLDCTEFKKRLLDGLNSNYSLQYLEEIINNNMMEQINGEFPADDSLPKELKEKILHSSFRRFNLDFRDSIIKILNEMQEEKKIELAHLIKETAMPITSFNPKLIEQSIYDKIKEFTVSFSNPEVFHKNIIDYISDSTWNLEMYDLYSMIRRFATMLKQTMGNAYIFFHDLCINGDKSIENLPLFLVEISILERPDSVTLKSERGVIFINTPAINSGNFESILTIPRAARIIEAPDYIFGVEKFLQSHYDFYNTFLLKQGFQAIVAENKPRISFRIGLQIVQKEDKKLLDYSELITRIDAGQGGKFINFVGDYVSGNVPNTTDEVSRDFLKKYPPKTSNSLLSTIPLNLNDRQKRILIALENPKKK